MAEGHASSGVLEVVVVSPARQLYEGEAQWVTLPAWDRVGERSGGRYRAADPGDLVVGQLGIRPGHAQLVAALGAGPLRIGLAGGQVTRFAVQGGFVKVGENRVTILVDRAVTEADVNEADARRELEETIAELQHPRTDEEFADLLERRAWSETRIKLASR
ncbi:MAG TPA: F0F1 ATP synthase subunit epsilon [Acidimicrobiia bacterium]|nr:F0F1 ATP synthase subunit epsilon [Acidimicrobiia bacterium]